MMNKIKNIFKSKVTLAILACLLLVGVFAGLTTIATGTTPTITVVSKNLNHDESARIIYTVRIDNASSEDWILTPGTMKFWAEMPADASVEPDLTVKGTYVEGSDDGTGFNVTFESYPIAPAEMTSSIYSAVQFDGVSTGVEQYSVFQYLCEMELDGASTKQEELYAALKDYIEYAQAYLGVTDKFPAPDTLAYISLKNAYIEYNGMQVRDGVLPAGHYVAISDFPYARYENKDGYICDYNGTDNKWNINLVDNKVLAYTAHEATKVTLTAGEGSEVLRVFKYNLDSKPAYMIKDTYAADDTVVGIIAKDNLHQNDHYFLAPTEVAGKVFSHWELNGVAVSTDVLYPLSDTLTLVAGADETVTDIPTPVFITADAANTHTFGTASGGVVADNVSVTATENGFVKEEYGTSASTGGGSTTVTTSSTGTAMPSRMYFSFDVNIETTNAIDDYANAKFSDFFAEAGYASHTRTYFKVGSTQVLGWDFLSHGEGMTDNVSKGYYLNLSSDVGNSPTYQKTLNTHSRNYMTYGDTHNIQFVIDLVDNGGKCEISNVNIFIDGYFAACHRIRQQQATTFTYNSSVAVTFNSARRGATTRLTVSNLTLKEYNI